MSKSENRKWYAPIWSGAKTFYKLFTSNIVSLTIAGVGLVIGVITGGTVPIAIAAITLGVKVIKTVLDAQKTMSTRSLDIENKALVDFVTALHVQQKTIELLPISKSKSELIKAELTPFGSSIKGKKLTYNKAIHRARQAVDLVDMGLGIAGVAGVASIVADPTKVAKAGNNLHAGVKGISNLLDIIGSEESSGSVSDLLLTIIRQHPEAQEQLVNFINSNREAEGVGYLDLQELREQTRAIKINTKAIVATLKRPKFYTSSKYDVIKWFKNDVVFERNKFPPIEKPETRLQKIWRGVNDALNPLSKYNPEMQEQSGFTKARRAEIAERAKSKAALDLKRKKTERLAVDFKKEIADAKRAKEGNAQVQEANSTSTPPVTNSKPGKVNSRS